MDNKTSRKIGELAILNLNPPLISKLDLMWIFNSNIQLVGVLIAEYNLLNDRIRISDQHKSCSPLSLLFGSF